jgi:dipeptidyl aminopeptidase/acylaminoacyl peptidase
MTDKLSLKLNTTPRFAFEKYANCRMAYGPSYSKDGSGVIFSTDLGGIPQLWLIYRDTGRMDQLTFYDDRVSGARFSPSNDDLVFAMDPGGSEKHQLWLMNTETLAARKLTEDDAKIHNFGDFHREGRKICYSSNERDERYFDIYVQSLVSPSRKQVFHSNHTNRVIGWHGPDHLIMERANTNLDNDLFLLREDGSADPKSLTRHSGEAYFAYSGSSEDKKSIYVTTDVENEYSNPAKIDVASGEVTFLSEDPTSEAFGGNLSHNEKLFAYFRNVDGVSKLYIYEISTGQDKTTEDMPMGSAEGPVVSGRLSDWSPDSRFFSFTFQGPSYNPNIWTYDSRDGRIRQMTSVSLAGIPKHTLVEPSRTKFPSFDGLKVPVLVYRPYLSNKPLPTVVFVHGGPESQETVRFNIAIQFFTNHGFLVLAPNVRGSTGYGKTWVHLDDVEKRLDSVHDLEALVKWAIKEELSLEGAVGIMGGSYGGFMVLSALTEYPDLWASGVDSVGIANFETFLENTAKWRRHLREAEYGSLERDRDLFKKISPIHHIERITAPLLIIHGANDPRVPVGEAEQIVSRLKKIGRYVEYIRFEDEGHGIAKIKNRVRANNAIGEFFDKTLTSAHKRAD